VTPMSKAHPAIAISLAVFLRWLAVGHVTMTVAGASFTIPALALAAVTAVAVAAVVVALLVWRLRADRAARVPWRAQRAGAW
jgi:voltage-gated potassium channel Kch